MFSELISLQPAAITGRRRLNIPTDLTVELPWRDEIQAKAGVTYELLDRGAVRMLRGDEYQKLVSLAEERAQKLDWMIYHGEWETSGRLTIPKMVVLHLLDTGKLSGSLFIAVFPEWLELWNNEKRLKVLEDMRLDLDDILHR